MKGIAMTSTLPRRTAAVTALAVTAFSGVALAGTAVSASAAAKAHTSLSIRVAKHAVNPGGGTVVSGDLRAAGGHAASRRVELLERAQGASAWTKDATHRAGRNGRVGFQVTPSTTTRYTLLFPGNKNEQGTRSGVVAVRVRDTTSLTIAVAATVIAPGASDSVTGVLSLDGTPLAGDTVVLRAGQKKLSNAGTAITAADGSVNFAVTPASTTHYRLVFQKTTTDAGARSAVATIHVTMPSTLSIRARIARKTGKEVISGDLRGGGRGLAHRKVTLQDRPAGSSVWTTVATKRTGRNGGIGFAEPAPTTSEDYQLVFAGGQLFTGCQSGVVTVTV
jgi:hypothetical protein